LRKIVRWSDFLREIFIPTLINEILLEARCRFLYKHEDVCSDAAREIFVCSERLYKHMSAACVMAQCCPNITVSNSPAGGDSYLLPANDVHHQHCASFDVLAAV
jgi:hypothetical protein